jgi:hypothetical protein
MPDQTEAIRAYETQLAGLGRWLTQRIRVYEHGWGGEAVGLLTRAGIGDQ